MFSYTFRCVLDDFDMRDNIEEVTLRAASTQQAWRFVVSYWDVRNRPTPISMTITNVKALT